MSFQGYPKKGRLTWGNYSQGSSQQYKEATVKGRRVAERRKESNVESQCQEKLQRWSDYRKPVLVSWDFCNQLSIKLDGLNQQIFILSELCELEVEISVQAGPSSSEGCREVLFPCLFLSFDGCQQLLTFLGLWQRNANLCLHLHVAFFPLCVCVSIFKFFLIKIPVTLDLGPTPNSL